MERFLIVCAGSAVGGGARYLVSVWAGERFGTAFPYGTLIVNLVGCFLITFVMHVAAVTQMPVQWRLLLTTGFMGGLTTYSSFDFETTTLLQNGNQATRCSTSGSPSWAASASACSGSSSASSSSANDDHCAATSACFAATTAAAASSGSSVICMSSRSAGEILPPSSTRSRSH
jgi:CrcB protein